MDIDGSSPPARGTLISPSGNARGLRFIPARAGNTWSCRHSPRSSPVHPRPRGEHQHHHSSRPSRAGSSPPARGTRREDPGSQPRHRFIPARAGNTEAEVMRQVMDQVHPRPRGEHWRHSGRPCPCAGSSPPARGTHAMRRYGQIQQRFIPARAGNTIAGRRRWAGAYGSSPPARGTLFPQDIDSKGVAAHQRPHQLRSPDPGEEAMARSRRVAPRFQLVPRWAVAARIARA